jgi:hypothetical protein
MQDSMQGRASIVAVGTATIFAAPGSGYRSYLTKGYLAVRIGTGAATVSVKETSADGSSTPVAWLTWSASAPGYYPIDLGPRGYGASATNSRVILETESSQCAVLGVFTGYTRG